VRENNLLGRSEHYRPLLHAQQQHQKAANLRDRKRELDIRNVLLDDAPNAQVLQQQKQDLDGNFESSVFSGDLLQSTRSL